MLPAELNSWQLNVGELHDVQLKVSPDEMLIACSEAIRDRTTVWALPSGRQCVEVSAEAGLETIFSPSSNFVVTCGRSAVTVAPVAKDAPSTVLRLSGATFGEFARLCLTDDEQLLLAASSSWLRIWNLRTHAEVAHFEFDSTEAVIGLHLDHSTVSVYLGRSVDSWSGPTVPQIKRVSVPADVPFVVNQYTIPYDSNTPRFSSNGSLVIYCLDSSTGRYAIWNRSAPDDIRSIVVDAGLSPKMSISHDFQLLAVGSRIRGDIAIVDASTGRSVNTIDTAGLLSQFLFSPTASLLAVVTNTPYQQVDRTTFVEPVTGAVVGVAHGHPMLGEASHCFSPQGRWFASASTAESVPYQAHPLPSGTIIATDLAQLSNPTRSPT